MELDVRRREIFRYLGYGNKEADEASKRLAEECLAELARDCSPKHIYREFPLSISGDGCIDFFAFRTRSRQLGRNLADCGQVLLFAATLGAGADLLVQKYERLQMSKAVVMQAAATALLEEYCDAVNESLKDEYGARGLYLRPRFSPGYGDFPLECQKDITAVLETGKRIGITLTDSLLMTPSKSVTAVMGISGTPCRCRTEGCEVCEKADCAYRRG